MPRDAFRADVQRLMDEGAEIVEVLPRPEYEWAHLPGAIHNPLKRFDPSLLDPGRPVVVYCNDFL